jgi:hypothetical protein
MSKSHVETYDTQGCGSRSPNVARGVDVTSTCPSRSNACRVENFKCRPTSSARQCSSVSRTTRGNITSYIPVSRRSHVPKCALIGIRNGLTGSDSLSFSSFPGRFMILWLHLHVRLLPSEPHAGGGGLMCMQGPWGPR